MATITVVKDTTTVTAGPSGLSWIGTELVSRDIEIQAGSITFTDGRVQKIGPGSMRVRRLDG